MWKIIREERYNVEHFVFYMYALFATLFVTATYFRFRIGDLRAALRN